MPILLPEHFDSDDDDEVPEDETEEEVFETIPLPEEPTIEVTTESEEESNDDAE